MDLFVHGTEDALPDDGRVDRAPIAGAVALFMLQKPGEARVGQADDCVQIEGNLGVLA